MGLQPTPHSERRLGDPTLPPQALLGQAPVEWRCLGRCPTPQGGGFRNWEEAGMEEAGSSRWEEQAPGPPQ